VWLAAAASLLLVLVLYAAGKDALLRIAIPAGAALTGFAFYLRRPIGYIHFALWAWFLTPLVRRLVDWRVGFEDQNLVLLAPFLVSAIAGLTLVRERRSAGPVKLTPFLLCIGGISYGFGVGVIRWKLGIAGAAPIGEVLYGLLNWLAPLLFGLHLYLHWPMYKEHTRAIQKSFLWAVLLLGAYGIYQYVAPPAWDKFWLEHMLSDLGDESFGRPEPFAIRVWSTMNSPGVFANVLMAGLLLLFFVRSRFKPLAAAFGYSAFLLSLVRTAWLGWLVGLFVLCKSAKGREASRLLLSLLLLPILVSPLMLNPQIATAVADRMQTFQSTGQDESFQDRAKEYRVLLASLATDPFGEGMSKAETFHGYIMDSGIVRLLYHCGWIGAALFLIGISLCARGMPSRRDRGDEMAAAYRAVLFAMLAELLSGNTFVGPSGAVLWTCIGIGLSLPRAERMALSLSPKLEQSAIENETSTVIVL
jgi:hypothetical protein